MLHTGLVSVTFRKLAPSEIIHLVSRSKLEGIEWGGDIHVPHGNVKAAREVYKMTGDAGLTISSYGSYYYVGCDNSDQGNFEQVLETAVELHAANIRVWAGNRGSLEADEAWWYKIIEASRSISQRAYEAGITLSYEYHNNTLTDRPEAAYRLLKDVNHRNIRSYWQPAADLDKDICIHGLNLIKPWLSNIHAYYWKKGRQADFAEGAEEWSCYMEALSELQGEHYVMLEFVKDNEPVQFLKDADVLKSLIKGL